MHVLRVGEGNAPKRVKEDGIFTWIQMKESICNVV
jgi:hypothetical protein